MPEQGIPEHGVWATEIHGNGWEKALFHGCVSFCYGSLRKPSDNYRKMQSRNRVPRFPVGELRG